MKPIRVLLAATVAGLLAVAAFVRSLISKDPPLDRFLRGDQNALGAAALRGLTLFTGDAGCIRCHGGSMLTDGKFHNRHVPEHPENLRAPRRQITLRRFFRTLGVKDYQNLDRDIGLSALTKDSADRGKFKTPSLREVARIAPYMHNGTIPTLGDVIDFYNRGGGKTPNKSPRSKPLGLSKSEKSDLVAFLESLSGDPVIVEAPELPGYPGATHK